MPTPFGSRFNSESQVRWAISRRRRYHELHAGQGSRHARGQAPDRAAHGLRLRARDYWDYLGPKASWIDSQVRLLPEPKETLIITGSSGLIGAALVAKFADSYNVVGFDLHALQRSSVAATFEKVDLTSDRSVRQSLKRIRESHGTRIASVIHLAAYFDLTGEPNPKYEQLGQISAVWEPFFSGEAAKMAPSSLSPPMSRARGQSLTPGSGRRAI